MHERSIFFPRAKATRHTQVRQCDDFLGISQARKTATTDIGEGGKVDLIDQAKRFEGFDMSDLEKQESQYGSVPKSGQWENVRA